MWNNKITEKYFVRSFNLFPHFRCTLARTGENGQHILNQNAAGGHYEKLCDIHVYTCFSLEL